MLKINQIQALVDSARHFYTGTNCVIIFCMYSSLFSFFLSTYRLGDLLK